MPHANTMVGWIVGGVLGLVLISASLAIMGTTQKTRILLGDTSILTRVAKTDLERSHGLSGTSELNEGQGMLFIFDRSGMWPIWMKDMNYPIDVIWLDQNKTVVDLATDLTPDSYPQSFKPKQTALYVLEVPSGFVTRHSIVVGDKASFDVSQ